MVLESGTWQAGLKQWVDQTTIASILARGYVLEDLAGAAGEIVFIHVLLHIYRYWLWGFQRI